MFLFQIFHVSSHVIYLASGRLALFVDAYELLQYISHYLECRESHGKLLPKYTSDWSRKLSNIKYWG
jgi:hypothetical protein